MSTHAIEIVEIGDIFPHHNPEVEKLELTHIFGWQCCIGKGQFKKGDKAIFISPDYVVPLDNPCFSFLKSQKRYENAKEARITIARFKGSVSQGLIIPLPDEYKDLPVGTDMMSLLGIKRYEPPVPTDEEFIPGPSTAITPEKFDVETFQRFSHLVFSENEEVIVTEKMDGTSARYTYAKNSNGEYQIFCGTRVHWVLNSGVNEYSRAFQQNTEIERWIKDHPDLVLYGEVFGGSKKHGYGAQKGQKFFAAFAILNGQQWIDFDECQKMISGYNIPWAPVVYRGKFDAQLFLKLAEEDSIWPTSPVGHLREGIVVLPAKERRDANLQACGSRVILKIVSNRHFEKS